MFKLRKIMNKSSNACEVEFYPTLESVTVRYGEILSLNEGHLTSPAATQGMGCPRYYALGDAVADDNVTKIPCVRVNEDMIFEATAMTKLSVGSSASLFSESEYDGALHVNENLEGGFGDAEVIDDSCYDTRGTLYVRIHKN